MYLMVGIDYAKLEHITSEEEFAQQLLREENVFGTMNSRVVSFHILDFTD
jgi:hypothetical protein